MKKVTLLVFTIVLAGCSPSSTRMQRISLGDNKEQVVKTLGNPRVVRGSIRNKYGQNIEVWEYRLALPSDDSPGEVVAKSVLTVFTLGMGAVTFDNEQRDYWLYFLDEELVKWGQAGDWQTESKNIYEIRFTSGHNL